MMFVPLFIAVSVSVVAFSLQRWLDEEIKSLAAGIIGWLCLFVSLVLIPWPLKLMFLIALLTTPSNSSSVINE